QVPHSPQIPVEIPKSSHYRYSSGEWRVILDNATQESKRLNHAEVSTEHILLAFLHDRQDRAGYLLRALGLKSEQVRDAVPAATASDQPQQSKTKFSAHLIAALGFATAEAYRTASPFLQSEHILLGIVHVEDSPAMAILAKAGITAEQVKTAIE